MVKALLSMLNVLVVVHQRNIFGIILANKHNLNAKYVLMYFLLILIKIKMLFSNVLIVLMFLIIELLVMILMFLFAKTLNVLIILIILIHYLKKIKRNLRKILLYLNYIMFIVNLI